MRHQRFEQSVSNVFVNACTSTFNGAVCVCCLLQGALEDVKNLYKGHDSLRDRYSRQHPMPSPHRRQFPFDKRVLFSIMITVYF